MERKKITPIPHREWADAGLKDGKYLRVGYIISQKLKGIEKTVMRGDTVSETIDNAMMVMKTNCLVHLQGDHECDLHLDDINFQFKVDALLDLTCQADFFVDVDTWEVYTVSELF